MKCLIELEKCGNKYYFAGFDKGFPFFTLERYKNDAMVFSTKKAATQYIRDKLKSKSKLRTVSVD